MPGGSSERSCFAHVQVLAAANATVSNNNDGGIAEAIERFIL